MKKKPAKRRTPKVPDAVEELRARMARSAKQVNALLRGIEEDVREVMEELLHARREREAVAALRARPTWGLGSAWIEAGKVHTFQSIAAGNTQRAYIPERLLLVVNEPGAMVDAFQFGTFDFWLAPLPCRPSCLPRQITRFLAWEWGSQCRWERRCGW